MTFLAAGLLCVAIGILVAALYRLPDVADRLVALDALTICALGACLIAAAETRHTAFLDVALGFAVVAFIATVSWANALAARDPAKKL